MIVIDKKIIISIVIIVLLVSSLVFFASKNKTVTDPVQPIKPNPGHLIETDTNDTVGYDDISVRTDPIEPIGYIDPPVHWLQIINDWGTGQLHLIYDGEVLDARIDISRLDMDGSGIRLMTNDDGSVYLIGFGNSYENIYCLYKGNLIQITDKAERSRYWLSRDGGIAYIFQEGALYRYDLSVNERSKVRNFDQISWFELSPDGRHALFNEYSYATNPGLYYYHDGKITEIGSNYRTKAVTNQGGIYLYDIDEEGLFYMAGPKGEKTELLSGKEVDVLVRNFDNTQFIFYVRYENDRPKMFFIQEGDLTAHLITEEKMKKEYKNILNSSSPAESTPATGASELPPPIGVIVPDNMPFSSRAYALKNLKGMLYIDNAQYSAWYLNENLEPELFSEHGIMIANDGNTILYIKTNDLYLMHLDQSTEHMKIASNVDMSNLKISYDGSTVCFLNTNKELFYMSRNNEPVKIADDIYAFELSPKDNTVFFMGSGRMLYSFNDETGLEMVSDNVDQYWMFFSHGMFYKRDRDSSDNYNDKEIYVRNPGEEFTRVFEMGPYSPISNDLYFLRAK